MPSSITMIAVGATIGAALGTVLTCYICRKNVDNSQIGERKRIDLTPELISEYLSRNSKFMDITPLESALVVVVGVGGVGSHCVHMLARSGVRKIRIVDFDLLTLSSLNRHAVGTLNDVGHSKCDILRQHLKEICPFVDIEIVNKLYNSDSSEEVLKGNINYVIDCIDNMDTKIHLIEACINRNIPIISSMGAGGKADASKIKIADISETVADPLARSIRKKLKKKGIYNLDVIFSTEVTQVGLQPLENLEHAKDYSVIPNFRSRIIPVLGPLPAMFGNALSTFVLAKLCNYEIEPIPKRFSRATFNKIYNECLYDERKQNDGKTYVTFNDFVLLYEEIYCCRSVLSGETSGLVLCRLDLSKELRLENAILVTKKERTAMEKGTMTITPTDRENIHSKLNKLKYYEA